MYCLKVQSFATFCFCVQNHLPLYKLALFHRDSNDKNTLWIPKRCCNAQKLRPLLDKCSFVFLYCRSSQFYDRVWLVESLKRPIFQTIVTCSICASLFQVDVKSVCSMKSCWHGFTRRRRVNIAEVSQSNSFANPWRLPIKSTISISFTCKHYKKPSNRLFVDFLRQVFNVFCEEICIVRLVQTFVGKIV